MSYSSHITEAMTWLGTQPDTIFLGQNIVYGGNAMFKTLEGVPLEKRIELPVTEDMQMGMSIGLALTGKTVISIYPRFDFLLCAVNQLVNHLDKLEEFTHGEYNTKVIIRVGIGSTSPMNPGCQHCGDYTEVFRQLLKNIDVVKVFPGFPLHQYQMAYQSKSSVMMVERMDLYD
jgi:pyruvate/2-oxoglutarate/acetoin dehydrogenase E1 component